MALDAATLIGNAIALEHEAHQMISLAGNTYRTSTGTNPSIIGMVRSGIFDFETYSRLPFGG